LYHAGRVALVLAVFAGAARAQDDGQGLMARLAANAGDISEASRDLTEGNITAMVPELLRRLHYSQHPFDAGISSKFLDRYLESLDGRHIYFLQSDLKQFEVYRTNLQTLSVSRHDYSPSTVIFARCLERVAEQTAYVTNLLRTESFEFTNHERFIANRHTLPNPTNLDQAHQLWRQELRWEYLDEKLKEGDMAVSGPARFDEQSNVVILLPAAYTNSVSVKSTGAPPDTTGREPLHPGNSKLRPASGVFLNIPCRWKRCCPGNCWMSSIMPSARSRPPGQTSSCGCKFRPRRLSAKSPTTFTPRMGNGWAASLSSTPRRRPRTPTTPPLRRPSRLPNSRAWWS